MPNKDNFPVLKLLDPVKTFSTYMFDCMDGDDDGEIIALCVAGAISAKAERANLIFPQGFQAAPHLAVTFEISQIKMIFTVENNDIIAYDGINHKFTYVFDSRSDPLDVYDVLGKL
jgi:hypothetical protein